MPLKKTNGGLSSKRVVQRFRLLLEPTWQEIRHDFVTAWHGVPQKHREGSIEGGRRLKEVADPQISSITPHSTFAGSHLCFNRHRKPNAEVMSRKYLLSSNSKCNTAARMGESPGAGLAAVQHADHRLLPRCGARSDHAVWLPRDLQHRPRVPIHPPGVYGFAGPPRHPDQQGRKRILARQRIRGTVVEKHQYDEEVYLHAFDTVSAAHQGLERYLMVYNQTRPH
jgi:hypothetical protein